MKDSDYLFNLVGHDLPKKAKDLISSLDARSEDAKPDSDDGLEKALEESSKKIEKLTAEVESLRNELDAANRKIEELERIEEDITEDAESL